MTGTGIKDTAYGRTCTLMVHPRKECRCQSVLIAVAFSDLLALSPFSALFQSLWHSVYSTTRSDTGIRRNQEVMTLSSIFV